jgi:hypothetical protein
MSISPFFDLTVIIKQAFESRGHAYSATLPWLFGRGTGTIADVSF